jgi:hypothetical protein
MEPEAYMEMLCTCFPGKKIFASGPVFKNVAGYPEQVKIFHSLNDLRGMKPGLQ